MQKRKVLPKNYRPVQDRGDHRKADGDSLELGSAEYVEYVQDRMEMSEFEQEESLKKERSAKNLFKDMEQVEEDKSQHSMSSPLLQAEAKREDAQAENEALLTTGERKAYNSIIKEAHKPAAMDHARKSARKTETKEDDYYVEKRLGYDLDRLIYDNGKDTDDMEIDF